MVRRFPHLQEIADEIPPFDSNAKIHLLIGRNTPELLKVREFIFIFVHIRYSLLGIPLLWLAQHTLESHAGFQS